MTLVGCRHLGKLRFRGGARRNERARRLALLLLHCRVATCLLH